MIEAYMLHLVYIVKNVDDENIDELIHIIVMNDMPFYDKCLCM